MTIKDLVDTCDNIVTSYELNITTHLSSHPINSYATHNMKIDINKLLDYYGDKNVKRFCIVKRMMLIEIAGADVLN